MSLERTELTAPRIRPGVRAPRNLAGLIGVYEQNWSLLRLLAPDLARLDGTTVSRVAGALDLYLTVLERAPYTTHILLTYHFDDAPVPDAESVAEPNARLCVYHDARMVELVSHSRRRRLRGVEPWRLGHAPDLYRRWEMNRFLQKWLRFCGHQGHLFLEATTTRVHARVPGRR